MVDNSVFFKFPLKASGGFCGTNATLIVVFYCRGEHTRVIVIAVLILGRQASTEKTI